MSDIRSAGSGERILAALAHLSILLGGIGPIVPAIIWVAKRRKSQYTSFQALQALGYSILVVFYILLLVLPVLIVELIFITVSSTPIRSAGAQAVSAETWMIFIFSAAVVLWLLPGILGIIGGMACLFGKEFRYPLLGRRLADYLRLGSEDGVDVDHEDRYVSAVTHACVMFMSLNIPYFIATPFLTVLSSKGRSQLLHFQSLQALVFQALCTVLSFGFLMIMMMTLLFSIVLSGTGNHFSGTVIGSANFPAVILLLITILIFLVFLLIIPLLQTLGLVAGYRLLKGKDYEYPLVGKLVKGWSWI
ncbi:MAG: DUF4870 domain-containing protein [Anaerolineaceae bacterium]|nr:DUF4870 domain-containing protein [Anaerolineaceae bacterium]